MSIAYFSTVTSLKDWFITNLYILVTTPFNSSILLQAKGLSCETADGTMLGTVKFEGSLPWEGDSDVIILRSQLKTFQKKVYPILKENGYTIVRSLNFLSFLMCTVILAPG